MYEERIFHVFFQVCWNLHFDFKEKLNWLHANSVIQFNNQKHTNLVFIIEKNNLYFCNPSQVPHFLVVTNHKCCSIFFFIEMLYY